MPEIQPFHAIRYDFDNTNGDISSLVAPPYDVLDDSDKTQLLARSSHNVVAIDLPHIPPKTAGPPEAYDGAARNLESWLADRALIRESKPALYVYHQIFDHDGRQYTRRMFICRVRLTPFESGEVLPHEKTFGGPKEDRLALMKTTKCQLSPIFGLYADSENRIGQAFVNTTSATPQATGTLDGVQNSVWVVTDNGLVGNVAEEMATRKIYIADGHHRYGTALLYRDWLAERNGGSLPDTHPANYIMFVLASMDDPGCLILPYYRSVSGIGLADLLESWKDGVYLTDDSPDLVLHDGNTAKEVGVRFSAREKLRDICPDQVAPWYDLDYAYLHEFLLNNLLARSTGRDPRLHYVKSRRAALEAARSDGGTALLVKATPMAHLRAVSEAGGLMPQKSTYFHPKLATGITINPLE